MSLFIRLIVYCILALMNLLRRFASRNYYGLGHWRTSFLGLTAIPRQASGQESNQKGRPDAQGRDRKYNTGV